MGFLIEPLAITLPVGAFNGSSIVDAELKPIEQHLIPAAVAQRSIELLDAVRRRHLAVHQRSMADAQRRTANTFRMKSGPSSTIRPSSAISRPHLDQACKIVGSSSDPPLLQRCEADDARGGGRRGHRGPLADLLSRRHAARPRQGHLRQAMARRLGISTDAVATIGDMQNDLAMFARSGHLIRDGQCHRRGQEARERM